MTRSRPLPKIFLLGIGLLGLKGGAISCSNEPNNASDPKIYGGVKSDRDEWLNVVALTDKSGIYCSGTALTPYLVLTAAHCLEDVKTKKIKVYVGQGAREGLVQGQYRVDRAGLAPQHQTDDEGSDHDIGYVVLKEPLDLPTSAYVPVATHPLDIASLVSPDRTAEIVGFGQRENREFGQKYHAQTRITRVTKTVATIGGRGVDACSGDSGGPAFGWLPQGGARLFGVASNGEECGQGGDWSLVLPDLCWLKEDSGEDLDLDGLECGGKRRGRD